MQRIVTFFAVISVTGALIACQPSRPSAGASADAPPIAAAVGTTITTPAPTPTVQTGRYTAVVTLPTVAQRDPLSAIVQIPRLPTDVKTVEQGMRYVLSRTGYSLAVTDAHTDSAVRTLYTLPIPEVQRTLGPLPVRDCLKVLAGQAFNLQVDRVTRVITVAKRDEVQESGV